MLDETSDPQPVPRPGLGFGLFNKALIESRVIAESPARIPAEATFEAEL